MRFIHKPLARILRATSVTRNDFNKLIDSLIGNNFNSSAWPVASSTISLTLLPVTLKGEKLPLET